MKINTTAIGTFCLTLLAACATGAPSDTASDAGSPHLKETEPSEIGPDLCGDGFQDWDEDCDGETDGLCADEDVAYTVGTLGCTAECVFDYSDCGPFVCGNGRVEESEECDESATDDYCPEYGEECSICRTDCTVGPGIAPTCGDGHVFEEFELCDPGADTLCADYGYDGGTLGCSDDCAVPDFSACEGSVCGNGILDDEEACDDGAENTLDCPYSEIECDVCTPGCERAAGSTAFCGDGFRDEEYEDCDPAGSTDPTLCDGYPTSSGTAVCTDTCKWDFDECVAGEVDPDVGTPDPDGGTPAPDVGTPDPDGGTPEPDAGPSPDTGSPSNDAGVEPTPEEDGCSSTRAASGGLWSLVGLAALTSRRRQRDR